MSTISTPILGETTTNELIPKLKILGETARLVKSHYPSVWRALVNQYKLDFGDRKISDELFERKLEVLLLQDDELRAK